MKSKWKKIALIGITILLAAGGILYYFYAVDKDKNGLTKKDVEQAEKALLEYITLRNQGNVSGCLNCLSEFYTDELESWRTAYERENGLIFKDFCAEYDSDLSRRQVGYLRGQGSRIAEYKPEAKVVYFSCSFSVTGSAQSSALETGANYAEYGFLLIKENNKWKLLANGY